MLLKYTEGTSGSLTLPPVLLQVHRASLEVLQTRAKQVPVPVPVCARASILSRLRLVAPMPAPLPLRMVGATGHPGVRPPLFVLTKPLFRDCPQSEWRSRQRYLIESHAHYSGHDLSCPGRGRETVRGSYPSRLPLKNARHTWAVTCQFPSIGLNTAQLGQMVKRPSTM